MITDEEAESLKLRLEQAEDRLRLFETASGIGVFDLELETRRWDWTPQLATLFGIDQKKANASLDSWERLIFADDVPKLRAALDAARQSGGCEIEFRVRHPDGTVRWLNCRAAPVQREHGAPRLCGACHDITERKALEARLLAVNEMLEARIGELREEAFSLDVLNRTGVAVAGDLDLESLLQKVTDAGVELSGAQFGVFFHYGTKGDDSYMLCTSSGAPRESFENFPMSRITAVFNRSSRGIGAVRSHDIPADPGYGENTTIIGAPKGYPPVRSYLAVPVVSRSGEVLGGLFYGHSQPGVFSDRAERLLTGVAAQAAVAIDNARLYQRSQHELAARQRADWELQQINQTLEERVVQRARELAASTIRLEESERRFRLLVEGVTDYAIFMLDEGGHIINWNTGAQRIKGYAPDEIIGKHFSVFYTEQDQHAGVPARALATAARTGKFEAEGFRVRSDGGKFWASVVINAIRDQTGKLIGFAKVTRDLTEQRASEERLRQAQKMESVGQLTGGIAHDFNNLLTVITGNVEALQRRLPTESDPNLQRLARGALHGAQRAAVLVQRLLAFSRRQPLEPKSISVNALISSISEILRRTLGETIDIETVLAGSLWTTFADVNQLENALLNLAINARDAMPEGGKLTIEAANVFLDEMYAADAEIPVGQYVGIFVSDTGTGMTSEVASRAFEPFFTTKEIGEGTGLGLSQVYGFIKQSGGHVKIYSEVGAGTTIKLYLPRHMPAADSSAQSVAPPGSTWAR